MKLTPQTLVLIFSFIGFASQQCYSVTARQEDFREIDKTFNKMIGSQSYEKFREESDSKTVLFRSTITSVCPAMDAKAIQPDSQEDEDPFLGGGGFGVVFSSNTINGTRAIKRVSFAEYLQNMSQFQQRYAFVTDLCVRAIVSKIGSSSIFGVYETADGRPQMELANLTIRNSLEGEEVSNACGHQNLGTITQLVNYMAQNFLKTIKKEFELSFQFSTYSQENESEDFKSFPLFENCIVTPNLDVHFVMQRLGPSLYDVRYNCPSSIGSLQIKERLLLYLRLFYKAVKLNELGYTNCDIKPENLVYGSPTSFNDLYFVDFGLLEEGNNYCKAGTVAFMSPEVYLLHVGAKIEPSQEFSNLTEFLTSLSNQADAFGVGYLLTMLELTQLEADVVFSCFSKLRQRPNILSFSMKYNNCVSTIQAFFERKTAVALKKNSGVPDFEKQVEVEKMFYQIIQRLLAYDHVKRYPLPVAMLLTYLLHDLVDGEEWDLGFVRSLLDSDMSLKQLLGIPIIKKSIEEYARDKFEAEPWTKTSDVYQAALREIEIKLQIKKDGRLII